LVLELVDGPTLKATLATTGRLSVPRALDVARHIAEALEAAHEKGIVHRDLKPANIAFTPAGVVKVLDFGLAKDVGDHADGETKQVSARTISGQILGTAAYMSPEQARGQAVDHRSDIFSLGIVLYEMVTGQLPFSGTTALDTLHAIAFEETRPMTALRANLPPSLQRVVTRCLRKRAQDRYPDAKELVGDLKTIQREVESGISSKAPLGLRLQEQWRSLRDRTLGEWLLPGVVLVVALAVLLSIFLRPSAEGVIPGLIFPGIGALLVWRRFRHRRLRLARRFVAKVRKMPEVRLVAVDGMRLTVVADRAQAKTYVRANALLDSVNSSTFFGEPFTLVIREGVTPEEEKALLSGTGVLYVREDEPRAAALPGTDSH
jgi:hypothetical protein